jgi:hypothetical protein
MTHSFLGTTSNWLSAKLPSPQAVVRLPVALALEEAPPSAAALAPAPHADPAR